MMKWRVVTPSLLNHEGHEAHEGLQDETLDSILQLCDVKVDHQADRNFRQSHVRKNLRLMNREQSFNALDFHNQVATYEQVYSVPAIEQHSFCSEPAMEAPSGMESQHVKVHTPSIDDMLTP